MFYKFIWSDVINTIFTKLIRKEGITYYKYTTNK